MFSFTVVFSQAIALHVIGNGFLFFWWYYRVDRKPQSLNLEQ